VTRTRTLATALALCATAVAGCGIGPGKDQGDVDLAVSRDYGRQVLLETTDSIKESDTVMRVLDRNADISTRYGGGFVQSIDGLSGDASGGRRSDWFFYVNGIESDIGAGEYDLSGGDRIWWDYRDWTSAMRVPAVVGSWPEPFVHGFQGNRWQTFVECVELKPTCDRVESALASALAPNAGVVSTDTYGGKHVERIRNEGIHVLVGTWDAIRLDSVARLLARAPSGSGVFARFVGTRKPLLELEDERGEMAGSLGKGGGLVAALREGDDPPVWVVTGTDAKGVAAAARLLGPALRNRYAVATQAGAGAIGVPVP
jgi:hypothetical protein